MASVPGLERRLVCAIILVTLCFVLKNFWDDPGPAGQCAPPFLGACAGLFLGVLHFPGSGVTRGSPRACKVAACALIIASTVFAGSYPWHQMPAVGGELGEKSDVWRKRWVMLAAVAILALLCVACILKQHPPSAYAHDAKWCVFSLWLCMMVYPAYYVCKGHGYTKPGDCLVAFTLSMESVVLGWIVCIFQARMVGMRSRHTSGKIDSQIWILVMCGAFFCLSLAIAVNRAVGTNSQEGLIMRICVQSVFLSLWAWYTFDVCRSLWRGLRLLQIETGRVGGLPRRQAHWASRIVCIELLLCMLLGTSTFATWFCITMLKYVQLKDFDAYKDFKATPWGLSLSVMRRLDVVINALSLALLSGILWQDEPPSEEDAETRRRSSSRGLTSMSGHLAVDDKEVYMAVVQQLARRGFRLSSLLDFWERLLEGDDYMPNFDPRRSLTNDVVRQAIIPRSKVGDDGFALASLWSDGQGMLPQTMVTHNWTNTFANLVAGILADAIGCSTYEEIVAQIVTKPGFARVKEDLGEKMDLTYWVCAFSVNQHASICGGFGREPPPYTFEWKAWHAKTCDSVTGEPFTPCTCKMEKIFCHEDNEDPRCELNKFDDMMHHIYVEERVAGFGQLIVVDNHFEVLYRAWCVAEIVEANVLQIPSRIEVPSQEAVDRNYDRLALLDVRDCSASSPRDKAMILSKIADVAAFNERLLDLVFSSETGLFSKWVDGQERSRQVGRILRRCSLGLHDEVQPPVRSYGCCPVGPVVVGALRRHHDSDSDDATSEEESATDTASV
mmetsp:Transcript_129118/g.306323  ORF Transcript_129118/g.306323 Transcript_129118/m.306323 type:complete len:784 (-) Transcript_129118:149-2500(-)